MSWLTAIEGRCVGFPDATIVSVTTNMGTGRPEVVQVDCPTAAGWSKRFDSGRPVRVVIDGRLWKCRITSLGWSLGSPVARVDLAVTA